MLSLFPELLFLAPFSALFIRVAVGIAFGFAFSKHIVTPGTTVRILGVLEGITALLLIAGAYSQAAALIGFFLVLILLFVPSYRVLPRSTLLLLALLCLSLVVTGAGPWGFDLPL